MSLGKLSIFRLPGQKQRLSPHFSFLISHSILLLVRREKCHFRGAYSPKIRENLHGIALKSLEIPRIA